MDYITDNKIKQVLKTANTLSIFLSIVHVYGLTKREEV